MRVRLAKNVMHNGKLLLAGSEAEFSGRQLKHLSDKGAVRAPLAPTVKEPEPVSEPAPVSAPRKRGRTTRKTKD